jgi:small multidrug resistance pump
MNPAWLVLVVAIVIEVCATSALPRSQGFRDPGWTAAVLLGYAASIWLLTVVVEEIPVSVAYAVWAGLGTAGVAVAGVVFLDEPLDVVKACALTLIIAGVVMLNLRGAH